MRAMPQTEGAAGVAGLAQSRQAFRAAGGAAPGKIGPPFALSQGSVQKFNVSLRNTRCDTTPPDPT